MSVEEQEELVRLRQEALEAMAPKDQMLQMKHLPDSGNSPAGV